MKIRQYFFFFFSENREGDSKAIFLLKSSLVIALMALHCGHFMVLFFFGEKFNRSNDEPNFQ